MARTSKKSRLEAIVNEVEKILSEKKIDEVEPTVMVIDDAVKVITFKTNTDGDLVKCIYHVECIVNSSIICSGKSETVTHQTDVTETIVF